MTSTFQTTPPKRKHTLSTCDDEVEHSIPERDDRRSLPIIPVQQVSSSDIKSTASEPIHSIRKLTVGSVSYQKFFHIAYVISIWHVHIYCLFAIFSIEKKIQFIH